MWLAILLSLPLLAYGFILAFFYLSQSAMLFPARAVEAAGPLPAGAEPIHLMAASGDRLSGLSIAPSDPGHPPFLVLVFGGNAWNAQSAAFYVHNLYPEAHVLAFHYRGYSPSEGQVGAEALKADSLLIHDFARERFGDIRMIAVGFSIGSGVAAFLASRRLIQGVILVTPFDKLVRVAAGHYPWLPVRWLFRHSMNPAEDLAGSNVPVAIIAAGQDRLIVRERTRGLAGHLSPVAFDRTIPRASHNDIYDREAFHLAMKEALEHFL